MYSILHAIYSIIQGIYRIIQAIHSIIQDGIFGRQILTNESISHIYPYSLSQ